MSNINTDKLQDGQIIKNYREFCKLIGENTTTSSKQRKRQFEDWSRYFEFEKIAHTNKYEIIEVYDTPIPKLEEPGTRSVYVKYIETLLLQYLKDKPGYTLTLSRTEAFRLLGMVNSNYGNTIKEKELVNAIADNPNDGYLYLNNIKNTAYTRFSQIFASALKSLEGRSIIMHEKEMRIIYPDGKNVKAADIQKKQILDVSYRVLNEMGYRYVQQVFMAGKRNEYFKRVGDDLYNHYGYERYYNAIKIIYVHANVIDSLEQNIIELAKVNLNQLTTQAVSNSMQAKLVSHNDKIKQEQENTEIGRIDKRLTREYIKNRHYFPENYEEINKYLGDQLLTYIFDGSLLEKIKTEK